MRFLFEWLLRLTRLRESYLLALLVASVLGLAVSEIYHWSMEEDYRERFNDQAWFAASNLETETMHGLAMGSALLLGLNESELKDVALGKRSQDDPDALRRLRALRLLLNADGVFVFNNLGDVVAHETPYTSMTGTNISHRLYWDQAIRGNLIVYPAVGTQTVERKLFIAAPVRAGTTPVSELIGAVVVETPADYLDYQIGVGGHPALLLSPHGVVFAATDTKWLFRLAQLLDADDLDTLRRLRQFGPAIPGALPPEMLPFDLGRNVVEFGGARYARAMAPVRWNDPSGDWAVVVFGDLRAAVSLKQRAIVGAVVALMALALMELFRRAIHYEAARRDAVAKAEAVAEELAAAARQKLQLSEITIGLQQARDPGALAALFFRQLAGLVPLHQGTLYFIDSVGDDRCSLCLAGSYGTGEVPEKICIDDGLLGQCARNGQTLVFSNVPPGFWRVSSGLGDAAPGSLILFPLKSNQVLIGVLEIASLDKQFDVGRPLVEGLLPVLSMNLEILLAERLSAHNSVEAFTKAEEYKVLQQSGKEIENWYHSVIDGAPDGLLVIDVAGRVLLSNPAANTLFGYADGEMRALSVADLIPEMRQLECLPAETSGCWRVGVKGKRRDGTELDLAIAQARLPATALHGDCACVMVRSCVALL